MEHPILNAIKRTGFTPLGWFEPRVEDRVPQDAKFVVLVGNVGFDMFRRFVRERDPKVSPIDDWTREVLTGLAQDLSAEVVFPFDTPAQPFLTWAKRGGAGHTSPLGLNIHNTYGLWHAYRAALLFPVVFDMPTPRLGPHPCETCADKPCLSACPVNAFDGQSYKVNDCAAHVQSMAGENCTSMGCLARRACPIGQEFTYHPLQAQFFMRAFVTARRKSDGISSEV